MVLCILAGAYIDFFSYAPAKACAQGSSLPDNLKTRYDACFNRKFLDDPSNTCLDFVTCLIIGQDCRETMIEEAVWCGL